MTSLMTTIAPKSDQLNADDLIGDRTLTIKVTKVSLLAEADQPIAIGFEGDNGKPYKPCKSMRRVLVNCWGGDGNQFIGRSMTLFRDDKVQFGGLAVGGIRISHLSNIDKDVVMALTASRANRKPYTVKPLKATDTPSTATKPAQRAPEPVGDPIDDSLPGETADTYADWLESKVAEFSGDLLGNFWKSERGTDAWAGLKRDDPKRAQAIIDAVKAKAEAA